MNPISQTRGESHLDNLIIHKGRVLLKRDNNHLVHGKHQSKEWKQAKQKVHTEYGLGPSDGSRYWRLVNDLYERMRSHVGGSKKPDAYREHMHVGKDGRLVVNKR